MENQDFIRKYLRGELKPGDMEEQIAESERRSQWDYLVKDGKIYLSADELINAMNASARFCKIITAIKGDPSGMMMSEGISVCADVVRGANSELLRREASRIAGE